MITRRSADWLIGVAVCGLMLAIGCGGGQKAGTPGPRPSTEDQAKGEPTLVAMKATGLTLKRVDLSKGVKELDRRVASVKLSQTNDGGIACTVETNPGSDDQYGGVTVPISGGPGAAYRVQVTLTNPGDTGRVFFQVNGRKRRLKWVWDTDAVPAAAGKQVIVFTPGKPSGPFEVHPQADPTIDTPRNAQLYIRPLRAGTEIGFILHQLDVSQ